MQSHPPVSLARAAPAAGARAAPRSTPRAPPGSSPAAREPSSPAQPHSRPSPARKLKVAEGVAGRGSGPVPPGRGSESRARLPPGRKCCARNERCAKPSRRDGCGGWRRRGRSRGCPRRCSRARGVGSAGRVRAAAGGGAQRDGVVHRACAAPPTLEAGALSPSQAGRRQRGSRAPARSRRFEEGRQRCTAWSCLRGRSTRFRVRVPRGSSPSTAAPCVRVGRGEGQRVGAPAAL